MFNEGNEATAAMAAAESFEVGTGTQAETFEDTGGGEGESFIVTESYVVPPATPKSHNGSITGVTILTTKTGSIGLQVGFHSDANGRDYEQMIWPPAAWIDNPRITRAQLEALPVAEGKKQNPLQRFGSAISNSKGTGDVDKLLAAAKKAGRAFPKPTYSTIEEFVEGLNTTLSGCPAVFTTKEEKNDDPQYTARERVNGVYGYDFDTSKLKAYQPAGGN